MLYITTRDNRDANTAYKTLHTNTATDGGAYIPFQMPVFTSEEIETLVSTSFSETVAAILNKFFSCKISGWDVDFCIGRNSVKIVQMPHRMAVAELWHNPKGTYESAIIELFKKIAGENSETITEWFAIAARIAIIFGIYTQMRQNNVISHCDTFDISLPSDDFDIPVAGFYARMMGLPIDTIVCTGDESSGVWDFINLGELNIALVGNNKIGFERYIYSKFSADEVKKMIDVCSKKRTYRVSEEALPDFNQGMFCATAGKNRIAHMINSIFRSNKYIIDPGAALCVGGLQDYRAKVGESKLTVVLSEISPLLKTREITEATGISTDKLSDYM